MLFRSKLPVIKSPFLSNLKYDLPIKLNVSISGEYSSKSDLYPNLNSEIKINDASFSYSNYPEFKDIFVDAYINYKPDTQKGTIEFKNISMQTLQSQVKAVGELSGHIKNPSIEVNTSGNVDMANIKAFIPNLTWDCIGDVNFNLSAKTNDLMMSAHSFYNDIFQGKISYNNLQLSNKDDKLKIESDTGYINIKNDLKRANVDAELFMNKGKILLDSIICRIDTIDVSVSLPATSDSTAFLTLDTKKNELIKKNDTARVNNIYTDITASFRNRSFASLDSINVQIGRESCRERVYVLV